MGCGLIKFILPFVFGLPIFAQQILFDHLTVEHGLSQSTVFSIAQDSTGFMWFATEDGLNKFDGYSCTIYRNDPSDPNSISEIGIRKIYVDSKNNLWIITLSGKLDRLDPVKEFFIHYNFQPDSLSNSGSVRISSITEDGNGVLWVGSTKGLLYKYDKIEDEFIINNFKFNDMLPDNIHLQCLHIDKTENFWFGTWQGLIRLDFTTSKISHYKNIPGDRNSIGGNMIFDISADAAGKLWIASVNGGVSVFDGVSDRFEVYQYSPKDKKGISSNRVMSVLCDSNAKVWIGTLDRGVDYLRPYEKLFDNYQHVPSIQSSLGNGAIFSIFEDRNNNIWFGTSSGGVSKFDKNRQHFSQISHSANDPGSLSNNVVLALYEDSNEALWVGTDGGGLNLRLPGSKDFKHFFKDPSQIGSNSITSIYEDKSGIVWLGTDPGVSSSSAKVYIFDRDDNSFTRFGKVKIKIGGVSTFFQDSYGNIWIGTAADGLRCFDRGKGKVKEYKHDKNDLSSISGNSVFAVYEDSKNNIWIGTIAKGLNKFNWKDETFTRYNYDPNEKNSISSNSVWCIAEDIKGTLWLGTWGGGLNGYNLDSGEFKHFKLEDGLPSNIIYGLLIDDLNNLWLSTSRGIAKFNIENYSVKNYDDSDGLQSLEFNQGAFCKGSDGIFYFGGINGVTSFHPEKIEENLSAPPIVFTNFKVFDEEVSLPQYFNTLREIVLSYQQNFFSFEFAALDFTAPQKNQYMYRLDGVDKEWVYSGSRRYASYTDVSPGEYVFHVKGSNNDGIWSKQEAAITITITPPFWQTWWFRIIAFLLLAGVLYAIHKYRLNKLLEVERTRVRIARDLHDDVSATLTGMVYFSDAIDREVGDKKTPTLKKLISLIHESATNVQESMSDIIWSINPENDKWEIILPKFRRYASDLCESKAIGYKIDIPGTVPVKPLDMERRRNFWLIFKEMITNAVKHSGCSELIISISFSDSKLNLVVSDNGKGFDPDELTEGNGVKNIQSRSKVLDGEVQLSTSPGKGTKWELYIIV